MKINQAAKIGALATRWCSRMRQRRARRARDEDRTECTEAGTGVVRQQTEELDPRVRSAEQMAMQVFDERDAPVRLDCAERSPAALLTRLAALTAICDT